MIPSVGFVICVWAVASGLTKTALFLIEYYFRYISIPQSRPTSNAYLNSGSYNLQEFAIAPRVVDRQVHFTVYRPDSVKPEVWNTMLAFAYRGGDPEETAGDIKESFKKVEVQAAASLGPQIQGFASLTTDSRNDIPRGELLRFVPRVEGLEFNPAERAFRWLERIHEEIFRFRARRSSTEKSFMGRWRSTSESF